MKGNKGITVKLVLMFLFLVSVTLLKITSSGKFTCIASHVIMFFLNLFIIGDKL